MGRLQSSIKISYSSSIVRPSCGGGCGARDSVASKRGVMSSGGSISRESPLSDSSSKTGAVLVEGAVDGDPIGRQLGLKEK